MASNKINPEQHQIDTSAAEPDVKNPLSTEETEALLRQKERREREPLLYCKLVTRWPLQSFLFTLGGHVLMIIISAALMFSGYDILPIDFENLPLEINDKPWRPRDLAWTYRNTFDSYYDRTPSTGYRANSYVRANIDLYYDGKGDNVLTKSKLEEIQTIENRLTSVSEYISTYCQLNVGLSACQKPNSIIRFFDGTYSSVSATFNDPNFNNIVAVIYEASTNNDTKDIFQYFLGKSNIVTSSVAFTVITRSSIPVGFPLDGYVDNIDDFETVIKTFSAEKMKPILKDIRDNNGVFDFSYRSDLLWVNDVFNQAMKDVLCAVGSICFISVFILIHTRSLWITGFAILSILTSFLATNLIYRIVFDFRYIGFFHVLTLFIVLGIGADDIFVFYDVWRNTAYEKYPSLAHRLSDSYRKSIFSMLFTSTTTAVAFFASAISPLLATRSFGVFSGLVIIVNYLSVILYFPTVVIMYHTKFEDFKWPCIVFLKRHCKKACTCCKSNIEHGAQSENETTKTPCNSKYNQNSKNEYDVVQNTTSSDTSALPFFQKIVPAKADESAMKPDTTHIVIHKDQNRGFRTQISIDNDKSVLTNITPPEKGKSSLNGYTNAGFEPEIDDKGSTGSRNILIEKQNEMSTPTSTSNRNAKNRKEKKMMVRFFRTKYFAFVTHRVARWIILLIMAIVLVFFIYQATKLEPDNEGLKVLKDSHVYSIAANHALYSFVASNADRTLNIYIVWGMHENNMDSCHFSTPDCEGTAVWDSSFNPSTQEAQLAVQNFCDKMFNFTPSQAEEYRLKTDFVTGEYQINCYIKNLGTFLDGESTNTNDWRLTYNYTKAISFMNAFPTYYDSSTFTSAYEDYLELPISYWLSNKYTYNHTNDFTLFDSLIGEETGTYSSVLKTDSSRKYGNNIKYVGIQVNTTLKGQTLGYDEGIPIMNKWEEFVSGEMANMPNGMQHGFQFTHLIWHWLLVQQMLAENAIYGIIIGVSVAFPILTIATRNFITGFLATFSMCCSTICVIGVVPLGGWKLGVLVSLNMCMVVGLTVDYVVHLAEGYTLSLHKDRLSRVQDMLDEMAVSIFFGACTTLGASMFMFLAQLSFFLQFGIFMFSTIGFSLFFAMGMFVTLMGICGPQNDTGNIVVLFKRLQAWCKSKRSISKSDTTQPASDG